MDPGQDPPNERKRAEKKRFTDRVAQQRHRQRQRDYVTDLEAQLRLSKEGGSAQVVKLMEENAQLRQELQRTNALLDDLSDMLGKRRQSLQKPLPATAGLGGKSSRLLAASPVVPGEPSRPDNVRKLPERGLSGIPQVPHVQEPEVPSQLEPSPIRAASTLEPHHKEGTSAGDIPMRVVDPLAQQDGAFSTSGTVAPAYVDPTLAQTSTAVVHDGPQAPGNATESGSSGHTLEQAISWWLDPYESPRQAANNDAYSVSERLETIAAHWPPEGIPTTDDVSVARNTDSIALDETLFDLLGPRSGHHGDHIMGGPPPTTIPSPRNLTQAHTYCSRFVFPPPPHDQVMHHILQVARSYIGDLGPPTFADFVLDNSPNPLSRELKLFANPMKQNNMTSEYLAAYWILYLLFRWHATMDESAYKELPLWLHPTRLQLEVEHLYLYDQIPWPDLRDEMIKLSLVDPDSAFVALNDIGRNIVVNMHNTPGSPGKNLQSLKKQISDLSRWKLAPIFFQKHPQWTWTTAR